MIYLPLASRESVSAAEHRRFPMENRQIRTLTPNYDFRFAENERWIFAEAKISNKKASLC